MGGPSPIPDQVLTYKVPKFDMESEAAIKEMTGTMSFNFIDTKKVGVCDSMLYTFNINAMSDLIIVTGMLSL